MIRVYDNAGRLVELWDSATRTYTRYSSTGAVVESRPFTAAENARADAAALADQQAGNEQLLLGRARDALATNASFLAIASPNNAQNAAQIKALTRQVNALIRLTIRDLSSVDDA